MLSYVLITPARNEAALIGGTIRSIINQSVRPFRWIIVSDGSTDGTDEIVRRYVTEHPRLGVAGTPFVEDSNHPGTHTYDHAFANLEHVSGACQLFRRQCFEEVGGYVPVRGGAIDWIAVTTARMKGWDTRTFTEQVCF